MNLSKGDKLIKIKGIGKPDVVFVVDEGSHMVGLSSNPAGSKGTRFFMNSEIVGRFYRRAQDGEQLSIPGTEQPDPFFHYKRANKICKGPEKATIG